MPAEMAAPAGGAAAVVFWAAAALAIVSAIGVVLFRAPIRGAVALLGTIGSLAVLFVLLDAHLLAAIQVIVYAGAVVVLFVFVIMVLGPASEPPGLSGRALFARVASIAVLGWIAYRILPRLLRERRAATIPEGFGTVEKLADTIFGPYLFHFELASILLLVAVIGAIAVAKGRLKAKGTGS